ncbi:MAG: hypothetical protein GXO60_06625 [Epsilonproteobacteria bacterium]|nr:hypothetical protein [Campylobacterota bacterium]
MKKIINSFILTTILIVISNCTAPSAPIYNTNKHHISNKRTAEDVYKSIKTAGASLGWIIRKQRNGVAIGKLPIREHMALVKIAYNRNYYSIKYLDSKNLKYDKESNTIHKNYNGWIKNLERAIDAHL